mmetsp:Transcript_8715/g.13014  ORF Transcript_8715/g.13014 Transcript_8715/m.13014 type:complete len:214 (+) Transcript_8715:988-1629(+)
MADDRALPRVIAKTGIFSGEAKILNLVYDFIGSSENCPYVKAKVSFSPDFKEKRAATVILYPISQSTKPKDFIWHEKKEIKSISYDSMSSQAICNVDGSSRAISIRLDNGDEIIFQTDNVSDVDKIFSYINKALKIIDGPEISEAIETKIPPKQIQLTNIPPIQAGLDALKNLSVNKGKVEETQWLTSETDESKLTKEGRARLAHLEAVFTSQ